VLVNTDSAPQSLSSRDLFRQHRRDEAERRVLEVLGQSRPVRSSNFATMASWFEGAGESAGYRTPAERKIEDRGFIRAINVRDLIGTSELTLATDDLGLAFDLEQNAFAVKHSARLGSFVRCLGTWVYSGAGDNRAFGSPRKVDSSIERHTGVFLYLDIASMVRQTHLRRALFAYNYLNAIRVLGVRHRRRATELAELLSQAALLIELAEESVASWLLEFCFRLAADALPDAPDFALPRQTRAGPRGEDPEESRPEIGQRSTKRPRHGRACSLASPAQSVTHRLRTLNQPARRGHVR
jgi:hypothetical protein